MLSAYAAQIAIAIPIIALTTLMWPQSGREPLLRAAATGVMSILVTPYGHSYELFCLPLAGLLLGMRTNWRSVSAMALLSLSWVWPMVASFVTVKFLPLKPFVAASLAWGCWRALRESREPT